MVNSFQAIILGLLQGITELFPVSSLGHSIILPGILGWHFNQNANGFLVFLVATHAATAAVLFGIYWNDWKRIIVGIFRSLRRRVIAPDDYDARLGWLLVVATIPAGIIGLLLQDFLAQLFVAPFFAAIFLALNGAMLFIAERFRRRAAGKTVAGGHGAAGGEERIAANVSWGQAAAIGAFQSIALIPGFSRTGSTIAGGLVVGLSHEDALRFSFLLATPLIGAAALLELPPLLLSGNSAAIATAALGAAVAGIAAYFSAKFLAKYFKTKTLIPFAIYCLVAGILSLTILR